jgi:GNAT superfamily N-acetyltransferase
MKRQIGMVFSATAPELRSGRSVGTHIVNDTDITLDMDPDRNDTNLLREGLGQHSTSFVKEPGFVPIAVFARDSGGALVGGAYGYLNWTWLNVSLLWVSSRRRKQGLGSVLLSRIETEAKERGCVNAHLDTTSYQARPFYEAHGYKAFAELPDYPRGHERIFLKKRL